MNVIETRELNKKYDNTFSIKDINITVPKGSITGFIGENGAGKTTVLKSILNIIQPDSGNIYINGKEAKLLNNFEREKIGIVMEDMFFPETLNAKNINSIMKNIYKTWDDEVFFDYLNKLGIPKVRPIKKLSKGMKKKLELSTALSHKPKLLIMDEPTSGLDPVSRSEVLGIFLDFIQDEENTILLSSHITSDLDKIADYIIFIDEGEILLNEEKDKIIYEYGILKCNKEDIVHIEKEDIVAKLETKYSYDILVDDKQKISRKYPEYIVDDINLEELMLIMIKGDRRCWA